MEFKELIEAWRSVRKYAPGEISKAEVVTSRHRPRQGGRGRLETAAEASR